MSPTIDIHEHRASAFELKFLVNPGLAEQIRSWARNHLPPDPHPTSIAGDTYIVTSLYCDTPQFDVFHRRGSFAKSKYRIRRYDCSKVAFLERKLKTRGMLAKRRSILSLDELPRLASGDPQSGWTGFWFHRRMVLRRLAPVCQISYDRTARVAMTPYGPIRLTLDWNVRALPTSTFGFDHDEGLLVMANQVILELKFLFAMPSIFKHLIEEFGLNPIRLSKYRLAAASLALPAESNRTDASSRPLYGPLCLIS